MYNSTADAQPVAEGDAESHTVQDEVAYNGFHAETQRRGGIAGVAVDRCGALILFLAPSRPVSMLCC